MWLIQLMVVLGLSVAGLGSYVKLPARYTAMKGDIPVSFHINKQVIQNLSLGSLDSQVYGSGQSLFAMVHLWYLEGDSYLFSTWSSMNAKPVASLAVPLGVTDGTVVFPCGAVVRAGPHAARLTVNGKEIAQSSILNVEWPAVNLIVPSRLETYSNDVEIEAKLTTNLCSQMLAKRTDDTTDQLPFQVDLELVQCSESVQANADCQVPNQPPQPESLVHLRNWKPVHPKLIQSPDSVFSLGPTWNLQNVLEDQPDPHGSCVQEPGHHSGCQP